MDLVLLKALIENGVEGYNDFALGIDAEKNSSPKVGRVYYAIDTKKVYYCAVEGVWIEYTDHSVKNTGVHGIGIDVMAGLLDIADDSHLSAEAQDAILKKHEHDNKVLLDSYTQTELEILNAVSKAHQLLYFDSVASVGGAASEALTITDLLVNDEIMSVTQKVPGVNNSHVIGFNTQIEGGLTIVYDSDPGAGSIVRVSIKRQ